MSPGKKIYYQLCSVFPIGVLKKMSRGTTLFPYHHLVSDEEVLHVKHLYPYKNTRQFRSDLDHLLKHFRPAAVEEITTAMNNGKKLPENSFLLSFDDGYREVYDVIAPILTEKGVPAVFFINPAFLDNKELFYRCKISLVIEMMSRSKGNRLVMGACAKMLGKHPFQSIEELYVLARKISNLNAGLLDELASLLAFSFKEYLEQQKPFLTTAQVKELAADGFTIGAHSWDHPHYSLISADDQRKQTMQSCSFVREHFLQSLNLFSFPHSDKDLPQSFFDHLREERTPVDLFFGVQNQKWEGANKVVHRFNAERPELYMPRQLNGVLMMMIVQNLLSTNEVQRK